MRIVVLQKTTYRGQWPGLPVYHAGRTYDVCDELGENLIARGVARAIHDKPPRFESATLEGAPETAVAVRKPKGRKRGST